MSITKTLWGLRNSLIEATDYSVTQVNILPRQSTGPDTDPGRDLTFVLVRGSCEMHRKHWPQTLTNGNYTGMVVGVPVQVPRGWEYNLSNYSDEIAVLVEVKTDGSIK